MNYKKRNYKFAWERDDLLLKEYAIENGYTPKLHRTDERFGRDGSMKEKVPMNPLSFVKGDKHIWFCVKGWACAELINNHYTNHRYYPNLKTALDEEK